MKHYDYIIAGAGCAGLSLLARLVASEKFRDKKILLVDKEPKTDNDRTWCFWEDRPGFFESVVHKRWSDLAFHSSNRSVVMNIAPYDYKMIRGIDFYQYCFELIAGSNVDILYDTVVSITSTKDCAYLSLRDVTISADYIFSSIPSAQFVIQSGKIYLWQHFRGWFIKTSQACFDPSVATLMDFRVAQQGGASFIYVLPITANRAVVEYTIFSKEVLPREAYESELRAYMASHFPNVDYIIESEEGGQIPMTNHRFQASDKRIIYIGTQGGQTKPSSGYTFHFIQSHSDQLVKKLIATSSPILKRNSVDRFAWYDATLLKVLASGSLQPEKIFEQLFCHNSPQRVVRFLNSSSILLEELGIISSLPPLPFLKAAFQ